MHCIQHRRPNNVRLRANKFTGDEAMPAGGDRNETRALVGGGNDNAMACRSRAGDNLIGRRLQSSP